jgi:lipopolysaccharide export LptBFGC system permease protein LptF
MVWDIIVFLIFLAVFVFIVVFIIGIIGTAIENRIIKKLKKRADAGDLEAKKELEIKLIKRGTSVEKQCYNVIGKLPDDVYKKTLEIINSTISQNGGSIEFKNPNSSTKNDSIEVTLKQNYSTPKNDKLGLVYSFYKNQGYKDLNNINQFGDVSYMSVNLFLKMSPEIVQNIGIQIEQEIRSYLLDRGIIFRK